MTRYALDTSTFSLLMRDDPRVERKLDALARDDRIAIPAIGRGEIRYGLARLPAGRRRERLTAKAEALFAALECDPVTDDAADEYGTMKRASESAGTTLAEKDLWIAAVAAASGCTLVASDGDFRHVAGVVVEDWSSE